MSRPDWRAILTEAADTQHTAALTWQECRAILDALDAYRDSSKANVITWRAGLVAELDGIPGGDSEIAHSLADQALLSAMPPVIQDAYKRVQDRCDWWASA